MRQYLTDNEIVFKDYETAVEVQRLLLINGYVTMMSREECFWILNYIWDESDMADRNAVIFYSRADYEYELYKEQEEKENDTDN